MKSSWVWFIDLFGAAYWVVKIQFINDTDRLDRYLSFMDELIWDYRKKMFPYRWLCRSISKRIDKLKSHNNGN